MSRNNYDKNVWISRDDWEFCEVIRLVLLESGVRLSNKDLMGYIIKRAYLEVQKEEKGGK